MQISNMHIGEKVLYSMYKHIFRTLISRIMLLWDALTEKSPVLV